MKKTIILLVALLFAAMQGAFAQRTITGKVIDENGLAMPGASVVIKGTTEGMATTSNGNFILNVPDSATIVVSFLGFKTVEIPVVNQTRFDIILQQDVNTFGEVVVSAARVIPPERAVVTAMGVVRDKIKLTYAIQTVSSTELFRASDPNFMKALSGNAPGIHVISDGRDGTMMQVIRGIKSWNYGGAPLFVIDGVPMVRERGDAAVYVDITDVIDRINPNDIESITVLKSANAALLYGSQGVNGVILITTKK